MIKQYYNNIIRIFPDREESSIIFYVDKWNLCRLKEGKLTKSYIAIPNSGESCGSISGFFYFENYVVIVDGYANIILFSSENMKRLDRLEKVHNCRGDGSGGISVSLLSTGGNKFLTFDSCFGEIKEWDIEGGKIKELRIIKEGRGDGGKGVWEAFIDGANIVVATIDGEIEVIPFCPLL